MQKVKAGIQDNLNIQIIEGLKTGDEVVSAPYTAITRRLKDGDKVEKVNKKDLFNEKEE
jgi:HlyD family secretion protein